MAVFLLLIVFLLFNHNAYGVVSLPVERALIQPDSTSIVLRQAGDENFKFFTDKDGNVIKQDTAGWYKYLDIDEKGNLIISDFKAGKIEKRRYRLLKKDDHSFKKKIKKRVKGAKVRKGRLNPEFEKIELSSQSDVKEFLKHKETGKSYEIILPSGRVYKFIDPIYNVLIILTEFSDEPHNISSKEIADKFGKRLQDYFYKNTNGAVDIRYRILDKWYISEKQRVYWGENSVWGIDDANDSVENLCKEVILKASSDTSYDDIDLVIIVHSGSDEAMSFQANDIWSHYGEFSTSFTVGTKLFDHYILLSESDPLGVAAHEFFHFIGAPDLYVDDSSSGKFALMDVGCWNDDGTNPSNISAVLKFDIDGDFTDGMSGFVVPLYINIPTEGSLADINRFDPNIESLFVLNYSDGRNFVFGYRGGVNYDLGLPDTGVEIWQIDENNNTKRFISAAENKEDGLFSLEDNQSTIGPTSVVRFIDFDGSEIPLTMQIKDETRDTVVLNIRSSFGPFEFERGYYIFEKAGTYSFYIKNIGRDSGLIERVEFPKEEILYFQPEDIVIERIISGEDSFVVSSFIDGQGIQPGVLYELRIRLVGESGKFEAKASFLLNPLIHVDGVQEDNWKYSMDFGAIHITNDRGFLYFGKRENRGVEVVKVILNGETLTVSPGDLFAQGSDFLEFGFYYPELKSENQIVIEINYGNRVKRIPRVGTLKYFKNDLKDPRIKTILTGRNDRFEIFYTERIETPTIGNIKVIVAATGARVPINKIVYNGEYATILLAQPLPPGEEIFVNQYNITDMHNHTTQRDSFKFVSLPSDLPAPRGIHYREFEKYKKKQLPEISRGRRKFVSLSEATSYPKVSKEIVGFYPYWRGTQYTGLRYDLITQIAYFSAETDSAGNIIDWNSWPVTDLIDLAHTNGVKVLITVTNFSSTEIHNIVSISANRQNLINNLLNNVVTYDYEGVIVDFEGVSGSDRDYLTLFMQEISDTFHNTNPDYIVGIATPAVDWNSAFDYAALSSACDFLFIMAYDYHWRGSTTAGPVAPIQSGDIWGTYNVTWTVNDYISKGAVASKLICGVPYYGYDWPTTSDAVPSSTIDYGSSKIFSTTASEARTYGEKWDTNSLTPYYTYQELSDTWHQCWYDNYQSVMTKYDLVKQRDMQGAGMWALTYDGSETELWEAIDDAFGAPGPPRFDYIRHTSNGLEIGWQNSSDSNFMYTNIYYSLDGSDFVSIDTVPAPGETTIITGLAKEQCYYFYLKGGDTEGNEGYHSDVYGVYFSDTSNILVVEDDNRYGVHDYAKYYVSAFGKFDKPIDASSGEAVTSGKINLTDYEIVVWFTGRDSVNGCTSLTSAERTKIKTYLDNGGKLFITGQDIAYDLGYKGLDSVFLRDYLKMSYSADDAGAKISATGVAGTAFDGISFALDYDDDVSQGGAYDVTWPDSVYAKNGGNYCLEYSSFAGAGVEYKDTYSLISFAFPFEGISDDVDRKVVMQKIIDFFENTSSSNLDVFIVDNSDTPYSESGTWGSGGIAGGYKGNYRYTAASEEGDTAGWTFDLPRPGYYNVYVWYVATSTRSTNAKYILFYDDGSSTQAIYVNQQVNGSTWNKIATEYFTSGEKIRLWLTDYGDGSYNIADAVKFTWASDVGDIEVGKNYLDTIYDSTYIKVTDYNLNKDPTKAETMYVLVQSTSDDSGTYILLKEDGVNTGVFSTISAGSFIGITTDYSGNNRIKVKNGDEITIKYIDEFPETTVVATITWWEDIIIDDGDAQGSAGGYFTSSGTWNAGGLSGGWDDDYLWTSADESGDYAKYVLDIRDSGVYSVYGWWRTGTDRSVDVVYEVFYKDGTVSEKIVVDQTVNSSQWNYITSKEFDTTGICYILIYDIGSNSVVIADAVRLQKVGYSGALTFLKRYGSTVYDTIDIRLTDEDLNTDPTLSETVAVTVKSSSDNTGINIVLKEVGVDTSVFTATYNGLSIGFSTQYSSDTEYKIKVQDGDSVIVEYNEQSPLRTVADTIVWYESILVDDSVERFESTNWEDVADSGLFGTYKRSTADETGDTARWNFHIYEKSEYRIGFYIPAGPGRGGNVVYRIQYEAGDSIYTGVFDQSLYSDEWAEVNTFWFYSGDFSIEIYDTGVGQYVLADAVRLTKIPDTTPPGAAEIIGAVNDSLSNVKIYFKLPQDTDYSHTNIYIGDTIVSLSLYDTAVSSPHILTGLLPGNLYYIGLRAVDRIGNIGAYSDSYAIKVTEDTPAYLIVEDDQRYGFNDYVKYYAQPLSELGTNFDVVAPEMVVNDTISLLNYSNVIWYTGRDSVNGDTTFTLAERTKVKAYLDNGGNIFITGQDVAYDMDYKAVDKLFLNDYLKADYSADDAGSPLSVTGEVGGAFDGISFSLDADDGVSQGGAYDVTWPDSIYAVNGGIKTLDYSISGGAAVEYSDTYRLIYFAFPFEGITADTERSAVMQRVMNFFNSSVDTTPPFAPEIIYCIKKASNQVEIRWDNGAETDIKYTRIYVSTDANNFSVDTYIEFPADTTIIAVQSGTFYSLYLTNIDTAGNESDSSDIYVFKNGSSQDCLIVTDDDRYGYNDYAVYYGNALQQNGYSFDCARSKAIVQGYVQLGDYKTVIWYTGKDSVNGDTTFTSAERTKVKTFLDAGGSLFVNGQDIAYDLGYKGVDSQFLNDYLKADYSVDDAGSSVSLSGVSGTDFETLTFGIDPDDGVPDGGAYDATWPDSIFVVNGGQLILRYSIDGGGGVAYSDTYCMVYFPFPFETITNAAKRAEVINYVLKFIAKPINVTVQDQQTGGSLLIDWDDVDVARFYGYEVWRSQYVDTGFERIETVGQSNYYDSTVTNNVTYYYKIRTRFGPDTYSFFSSVASGVATDIGNTVTGNVTLEGRSDYSGCTIYLISATDTYIGFTDVNGTFVITGVQDGIYTFKTSTAQFVDVTIENISINQDKVIIVSDPLTGGDVVDDNAVNLLDAAKVKIAVEKGDYDASCDINGDGVVDVQDLNFIRNNFGKR